MAKATWVPPFVEKRVCEVQALLVEQYKRGQADPDDWVR
jgi:hypothetical protein